jgi:putative nucleotidyltransferase with HDIG domain
MNRRAVRFILLVSAIGIVLAALSFAWFARRVAEAGFFSDAFELACLVFLCTISSALPIRMRDNQWLDVSIISILAVYLTRGMEAAISIWIISGLILYLYDLITKPASAFSRSGLMKFFFNNCTIVVAIFLASLLCGFFPWKPGEMAFPMVLLPTLVFSVAAFMINGLIMLTMFRLNGEITGREMLGTMRGLLVNVLAAMPLGLLIAELLSMESGAWIAMIMLFPLLLARYAWQLYLDSQKQQARLIAAFVSTMEAKDTYTQGHSERVGEYAEMIARAMDLGQKKIAMLREAAVLHDVGKIGIEDYILRKPGPLDPDERRKMQEHPMIGVKIVEQVGLSTEVVEIIGQHHERPDGKGYPAGIGAEKIVLGAKILGVADAFDAMTSDRPYRKGMPRERAVQILKEESGKQFDPSAVEALLRALDRQP